MGSSPPQQGNPIYCLVIKEGWNWPGWLNFEQCPLPDWPSYGWVSLNVSQLVDKIRRQQGPMLPGTSFEAICDPSMLRFDLRRESLQSNASVLNQKGIAGEFVGIVCCFRCPNDVCIFPLNSSLPSGNGRTWFSELGEHLLNTGLIAFGPCSAPSGPKNTASAE